MGAPWGDVSPNVEGRRACSHGENQHAGAPEGYAQRWRDVNVNHLLDFLLLEIP